MIDLDRERIKTKAREELTQMILLTLYLAPLFAALTTYKRLILAEQGIAFGEYGYAVIDALVLAKAILLGTTLQIGSSLNDRPLVIPAIYKTLCFSCLVLVLGFVERVVKGLWAGKSISAVIEACAGPEKWAILARVVMLFFALIPLFAVWETNRVLGGNVLYKIFFEKRDPAMKLLRD